MKSKATLLFLMAIGCASGAPLRLTLRDALKISLEQNPALKRQAFDVQAAHEDIVSSSLRPNPQLSLNGDMVSTGLPGDVSGPLLQPQNKMYGFSLAFPFETGEKRSKRVTNAKWIYSASQHNLEEAKRQTLSTVANAWLDAYQAKLNRDLNLKAQSLLDSLVTINRTRLHNQVITNSDLARSIVAARQYAIQVEEANLGVSHAERTLAFLLGFGTDFTVEVNSQDSLDEFSAPDENLAVDSLIEARSDVKVAKMQWEAAKVNYQLQKALAVPDITLSTDFSEQQGVPFYGLSLSLPLPIFSRNQGEISKAEIVNRQAEMALKSQRSQARFEMLTAQEEYQTHKKEKIAALINLKESRNVLEIVEYSYRSGSTTILDFLDAQRTWYDTWQAYNDASISLRRSAVRQLTVLGMSL